MPLSFNGTVRPPADDETHKQKDSDIHKTLHPQRVQRGAATGTCNVETDEEPLEGVSFSACRRVPSVMRLRAKAVHPGLTQSLTVDANVLDAALKRDRAPMGLTGGREAHQEEPATKPKPRQQETDRQAMDRAEDEGLIVHPR